MADGSAGSVVYLTSSFGQAVTVGEFLGAQCCLVDSR
jgi:hypothetical protein